ncbi:hypothetical protein IPH92_05295 [Candidatus Kaiserbacteria bacterium]|nr:MAG: hypothetical protein IPH92_05295 [Candidatus Kaiserbacteria bacterium]
MDSNNQKEKSNHDIVGSTQLIAGQKFHHQGENGVVYFQLNVVEMSNGSLYPMTRSANACNVLPLEMNEEGEIIAAYFLSQKGREETKDNAVALKAVGSFCNVGESGAEGALRSLDTKLGMKGLPEDLIFVGQSYGFGDQFQFPIDLFVIKQFTLAENPVLGGCERVRMTIEDIAIAQKNRTFFNSETIDLIATVLLRNQCRDIYEW